MTKKQFIQIITREIEWCETPSNRTMPEDWSKGFVEGLKQSIKLIKKFKVDNHD